MSKHTTCCICDEPLTMEMEQDQGVCCSCDALGWELQQALDAMEPSGCPVIEVFHREAS